MSGFNGFRGIVVCAIATLFCTYQFMLQGALSFMVPELTDSLSLDLTEVGFLSSGFLYIYILFQVPGGMAADHFCLRKLLSVSCLLMALAVYWFSMAESYTEALLARGLMGISTSPAIVVCMTLVARWFPDRWFPVMSGLVESSALIGGAMGPMLIPMLMDHSDWRGSMEDLAYFGVWLSLLVFLLVRDAPKEPVNPEKLQSARDYDWPSLIFNSGFWLCCLFGFGVFVVINSFAGLWCVPFLHERFPGESLRVREAVSLIYLGAAIGVPLLGLLASLTRMTRGVMLSSCIMLILATVYAFFSGCTLDGMCYCCFGIGFFAGGYMLVFGQVRKQVPESMEGVAMATANGFMLLGGPLVQPLIGFLLGNQSEQGLETLSLEHYQMAFLVIVGCQLLALFCILRVRAIANDFS
ncbi:MAG: MFS transporter [Endozoicomonas sp.]|uniref:MFS transporter n=1 Tax=Endozoicomonas sp. TaxID=1892382 RepID=UPI003D9AF239